MTNRIVSEGNIGGVSDIFYDGGTGKIMVTIDDSTIIHNGLGKLEVDVSALNIVVVSTDAGNVVSIGSDTGAFIGKDAIKEIVGEMVASNVDGIDYDAIGKTLKAFLTSLAVTDTSTVDLTQTTDADDNIALKADVKVSVDVGNAVEVKADGLFVKSLLGEAVQTVKTTVETYDTDAVFITEVDGVADKIALVDVQDLSGTHLFYGLA